MRLFHSSSWLLVTFVLLQAVTISQSQVLPFPTYPTSDPDPTTAATTPPVTTNPVTKPPVTTEKPTQPATSDKPPPSSSAIPPPTTTDPPSTTAAPPPTTTTKPAATTTTVAPTTTTVVTKTTNSLAPVSSSSSSLPSSSTSSQSSTTSDSPTSSPDDKSKGSNTSAIVGGVVGGLAGLALIGGLLTWMNRKGGCTQRNRDKSSGRDFEDFGMDDGFAPDRPKPSPSLAHAQAAQFRNSPALSAASPQPTVPQMSTGGNMYGTYPDAAYYNGGHYGGGYDYDPNQYPQPYYHQAAEGYSYYPDQGYGSPVPQAAGIPAGPGSVHEDHTGTLGHKPDAADENK